MEKQIEDTILLIQGPVISKDYDCKENIQKTIELYGDNFKSIVISTWENSGLLDKKWPHPNVKVIESKDVGQGIDSSGVFYSNRKRHIHSSWVGCSFIFDNFCPSDLVIKTRTDIFFDLKSTIIHIKANDEEFNNYRKVNQKGFIYFLFFCRNNPYVVSDFVFSGKVSDVYRLINAAKNYIDITFRENEILPEGDLVQKHIYANLRTYMNFQEYRYFPMLKKWNGKANSFIYPAEILEPWYECLKNSFSFFPKKLVSDLTWRGQGFFEKAIKNDPYKGFHEDWLTCKDNPEEITKNDLVYLVDTRKNKIDIKFYYLLERLKAIKSKKNPKFYCRYLNIYRSIREKGKKYINRGLVR
jgi:hypothetical protein